MSKRMEVRRDGSIFTVFDDGNPLGNFPTFAMACAEILARGGRLRLHWDRTVIAGEARSRDFVASFEGDEAGRIYHEVHSGAQIIWKAFPQGHNRATGRSSGGTQIVDTKDEAVAFIERHYTEVMAGVEPTKVANAYAKAKGG